MTRWGRDTASSGPQHPFFGPSSAFLPVLAHGLVLLEETFECDGRVFLSLGPHCGFVVFVISFLMLLSMSGRVQANLLSRNTASLLSLRLRFPYGACKQ